MKNVVISITGTQSMEEGLESIELVTDGTYCYDGTEGIISYNESELTGMEGTKTTFKVEPDYITLIREGTVNSHMVFQRGKKHLFIYDTPFGAATLGVNTRRLSTGLHESGGDMELEYAIDVDNTRLGVNAFKIHIKEADPIISADP